MSSCWLGFLLTWVLVDFGRRDYLPANKLVRELWLSHNLKTKVDWVIEFDCNLIARRTELSENLISNENWILENSNRNWTTGRRRSFLCLILFGDREFGVDREEREEMRTGYWREKIWTHSLIWKRFCNVPGASTLLNIPPPDTRPATNHLHSIMGTLAWKLEHSGFCMVFFTCLLLGVFSKVSLVWYFSMVSLTWSLAWYFSMNFSRNLSSTERLPGILEDVEWTVQVREHSSLRQHSNVWFEVHSSVRFRVHSRERSS